MPSVPPLLSAVVLKLLGKAAEERYQSAEGLKADLVRYEEGLRRGVAEEFPLGRGPRAHGPIPGRPGPGRAAAR